MKTSGHSKGRKLLSISFMMLALIGMGSTGVFAQPYRVAIIPFQVHAEKDLTFLKNGIFDMLASRLSWGKKVMVISREETEKVLSGLKLPLNETSIQHIGTQLGVDFVLYGSLTVIGESASIDAKMADVSGKKPVHAFFSQSQTMSRIIPEIDRFATEINETVFGRVVARKKPQPAQPQPAQPNIYIHPEKLVEGGFTDEPLVVAPKAGHAISARFSKTRNFRYYITGMALGDVNGDGDLETVIATHHRVYVYRSKNNRFLKIAETPNERYKNFIGVDVADINANGVAEIFVSGIDAHRKGVASMVLEYSQGQLRKIVDDSTWYYRVVELPGRGSVLLGQRQKQRDPFRGDLYEMVWEQGTYVPEEKILFLKQNNLMGLTFGDAINKGQNQVVAYNQSDRLQVIDPPGEVEWTGNEYFGGSMRYFLLPKAGREETEKRQYLPMRLRIKDIDGDGKNEVIAVKNHEMTGRHLEEFRKFKNSQIMALSWDGIGLARMWATRKVSGHISDFGIGDFDNDGADELVAALNIKEGSVVLTRPKSTIIIYDLKRK